MFTRDIRGNMWVLGKEQFERLFSFFVISCKWLCCWRKSWFLHHQIQGFRGAHITVATNIVSIITAGFPPFPFLWRCGPRQAMAS